VSLGLRELWRDRRRKQGLYDSPAYWDKKATRYSGLARSNWPSNTYNRFVHQRQMGLVDELLGDVRGLRIADVGCGTGRASIHLAKRGARVTGFDFSPEALRVAKLDAEGEGLDIEFFTHDVLGPPRPDCREAFDVVLVLGCLTLACRNVAELDQALGHLAGLLVPGGKLLFVEPIHSSRLLRRILALGTADWIAHAETLGFDLVGRGGLLFVPARLLLAFRDWPERLVRPAFRWGERVLAVSPRLGWLADYKWLLFRLRDAG
jgi:2-polyprenyl-3-methyl-5-hydroxy-6-metoxy-1,4-benzoquinol methylase